MSSFDIGQSLSLSWKLSSKRFITLGPGCSQSEIPLPSNGFLFDLLEPWDIRALSIRKTAGLPLQLCVGTFPRFVAIGFYFLSETLIQIVSPIIFLFIHNHLTPRKWSYTPLQHDFALDPMIPPFVFHFSNICHATTRKPRLPQCIMGDDLHINKQTNICIANHTRLLRQNN